MNHALARSVILVSFIAFVLITFGCRKDTQPLSKKNLDSNHITLFDYQDHKIKKNQAITVYDSTLIIDSIDFVSPPTDKYYQWEVMPNNGCDSIWGNQHSGIATFIFHCAGTYHVTAKVYDSLTHSLIANTDTVEIKVTTETLYPTEQIKPDDILNMRLGIVKRYHDIHLPPDEVWLTIGFTSTKHYSNYMLQFDYTSNISANNYSFIFNDVRLTNYPFAPWVYETTDLAQGGFEFHGLTYGVPINLHITWLGVTYSGTITLVDQNHFTFNWNSSGAVKMY